MKKLLIKLFPKYFNVCKHISLNFEDLESSTDLELVVVDDETNNTFDRLGIDDELGEFLFKEVKKAMIDTDCRVEVMQRMSKHIKHINEFYICVLIMEREAHSRGGGDLLKAILGAQRPPEKGE